MDLDEIDPGKRRKSSCFAEGSLNKFSILPFIKLILLLLFFRVHPLCTTARRRIPESGDFAQSRAASKATTAAGAANPPWRKRRRKI